ncbi:hypothetical protein [Pseudovibrio ascidiaceicola]|uniref:hypothetical protein n=1 Tax=Pseudovibrio ascidiaceicola TaxID=285279 RepID=UPI000D6910C1|nr:hypothetical protein [Pseudovibrio ascidiaceicola]
MANFQVYKGIVQHSPKSCGAYCVNAAMTDLGLAAPATDVNKLNTADVTQGYDGVFGEKRINLSRVVQLASERLQVAEEVTKKTYSVTGNLELRMSSMNAVYLESSDCTDLENSPSGMVEVAVKIGPTLSKKTTYHTAYAKGVFNGFTLLNASGGKLFDREEDIIKSKIGAPVTQVGSSVTSIPFQTNQVNLMLVQYANTHTMHWVAGTRHVSDSTKAMVYDPATGDVSEILIAGNFELSTNSAKPATDIGPNSYEFPGIWVRLEA